jgi:hypothetical protein
MDSLIGSGQLPAVLGILVAIVSVLILPSRRVLGARPG